MKKKTKWTIASTAVLAVAALVVPLLAQPGPGPFGPGDRSEGGHGEQMMARFADELDLTEEQTAQLGEIFESRREGPAAEQREILRGAREQLRTVVQDPNASEQQVIDAVGVVSAEMQKMALEGHQIAILVGQVLTEDQIQKLNQLREERPGKHGRFRHGRGRSGDGI